MKRIFAFSVLLLIAVNGIFADTETVTPTVTSTVTQTITDTVTNAATFTPTVTQTVSCTFTPTYTATQADTKTITQTITPSPTATVTSTRTSTRTITNTSTSTATCTFSPTFSVTQTVTQTGTASATVTITATLTPYVTATIPAGMEVTLKNKFYPNPAKAGDAVYLLTSEDDMCIVTIYSIDGREVLNTNRFPVGPYIPGAVKRFKLDTAGLAPGLYFYKVSHDYGGSGIKETSKIEKLVLTK